MNKIEKFIGGVFIRLGLFIVIAEVLKDPKKIRFIRNFIIVVVAIQILIGIVLLVTNFDKNLYKKEIKELAEDYN